PTARAWLTEALGLARGQLDARRLAQLLGGAAGLATADGRVDRALRLAGAADGQWDRMGAPRPEIDRRHLDRWLAPALAALGDARAAQVRAVGRAMTLDQAVAYALSDQD